MQMAPAPLSGLAHALPRQFATAFPDAGAPQTVSHKADRENWLTLAQTELLAAVVGDENRLLAAWVEAHPKTLFAGKCPDDADP